MEITLYERNGKPVAYIATQEENAIYLWDGHAVCYIEDDKIFGWRGKHIGWFVNNIIYDTSGYQVGYTADSCPSVTYVEPVKYVKYVQNVKYVQYVPYVKPSFSYNSSKIPLKEFLSSNKV